MWRPPCPSLTPPPRPLQVRGDTRFKCAPPLRGSRNRDMLWRALADGTVDFLASDHTPTTLEMRAGSFALSKSKPGAAWVPA